MRLSISEGLLLQKLKGDLLIARTAGNYGKITLFIV